MNDADSFDLSNAVERKLDELNDIFKTMRWLEFTHALNPHQRDLADYQMLIDDLAVAAQKLTQELPTASQPGDSPATLAASDFPAPIHGALTARQATPAAKPRDNTASRTSNHITR